MQIFVGMVFLLKTVRTLALMRTAIRFIHAARDFLLVHQLYSFLVWRLVQYRLVISHGIPFALLSLSFRLLLAQDICVEERFGFQGHLPGDRVSGAGKKRSGFLTGRQPGQTTNMQHPASNLEHRKAGQSHSEPPSSEAQDNYTRHKPGVS